MFFLAYRAETRAARFFFSRADALIEPRLNYCEPLIARAATARFFAVALFPGGRVLSR